MEWLPILWAVVAYIAHGTYFLIKLDGSSRGDLPVGFRRTPIQQGQNISKARLLGVTFIFAPVTLPFVVARIVTMYLHEEEGIQVTAQRHLEERNKR